ncbi:efflux transporter outer membrane subunit [Thalassolituus sp. LLYu03]|uniref:efflux transporter outer membrane subunit n=1 Tax=Thalassolituus sp. LLYu03 TaxID=3421656 RepID=UPI003D2AD7F6
MSEQLTGKPTRGPKPAGFLLLALAVAISGCASLPDEQSRAAMKDVAAVQMPGEQSAANNLWPQDQWWLAYGDAQLNQLMDEALASSPDLTMAQARLAEAAAMLGLSTSALRPDLSLNASVSEEKMTYNGVIPGDFTPQGWNSYGRLGLDMRWELDFWGKNSAALAAATSELTAREAEVAQARLLLTSAVASAYAGLNSLTLSRDTAARSADVRGKTAELFAKRHQYGMENIGSVREAEARRAVAEGVVLALDEQIAVMRNQLAALLGAGPERGLSIGRPALNLNAHEGVPQHLALDLLGRRPDIVAARLRVEAQDQAIASRRAAFYPNVSLTAFVGVQSLGVDNLFDDGSDIGGVGPAISLPLFNGGRLRADLFRSEAHYDQAVAAYNSTITHALQEVADVLVRERSLEARISKAEEAVAAASEAHRVAKNRYEGGLASNLQVLSAEDALLISQEALTGLQTQALVLDVALNKALGGGYQEPDDSTLAQSPTPMNATSAQSDAAAKPIHHL